MPMYCSVLIQGKLVGLEGKAPGVFLQIFQYLRFFKILFVKNNWLSAMMPY